MRESCWDCPGCIAITLHPSCYTRGFGRLEHSLSLRWVLAWSTRLKLQGRVLGGILFLQYLLCVVNWLSTCLCSFMSYWPFYFSIDIHHACVAPIQCDYFPQWKSSVDNDDVTGTELGPESYLGRVSTTRYHPLSIFTFKNDILSPKPRSTTLPTILHNVFSLLSFHSSQYPYRLSSFLLLSLLLLHRCCRRR